MGSNPTLSAIRQNGSNGRNGRNGSNGSNGSNEGNGSTGNGERLPEGRAWAAANCPSVVIIRPARGSAVPDFRDLIAWQKTHQLVLFVYKLTAAFPASEQFALTDQLRRPAASISANIAEGRGRSGDKAFAHYLDVALGSVAEVQALTLLARDLNYVEAGAAEELLNRTQEVGKMIGSLMARCRKSQGK